MTTHLYCFCTGPNHTCIPTPAPADPAAAVSTERDPMRAGASEPGGGDAPCGAACPPALTLTPVQTCRGRHCTGRHETGARR